jgi:hypothetical protein
MHKSENRKPTFDLALGFEIDYQCESSYFNLVRESVQKKHSKSKTEESASPDIGPYITADFSRFQIFIRHSTMMRTPRNTFCYFRFLFYDAL